MKALSRREFVRLAAGGALLTALGACGPEETATSATLPPLTPTPKPTVPRAPTAPPTSAPVASPAPTATMLRGQNVPGFYVRFIRPVAAPDRDRWRLAVEGMVRQPQRLSLGDVQALPRVAQVSRMKCVECWSAPAAWEGFALRDLMALVEPQAGATWVHFSCADGYYESMRVEQLLEERVLFVHHMNGELLPDLYGAPLRLMVPFAYGYKSAKAIVGITFAKEELVGFWPENGPYTNHGLIRPGRDHPLDLGGTRRIEGGEIFYEDGIESRG
ncbi:MAG: molybdopterin-dependent oxidoreductase [Anaerolineae bacterium]